MKRQILFVFGSQACVPGDPLLAARELGCQTAVMGPRIPCGMPAELVDRYERVDLNRPDEVVEAARALHGIRPIHAVVGYDDQAVPVVAQIAANLGLPGHPKETAEAARDKLLMKRRFESMNIPIAPYTLAANEDDAVRWANKRGYPVVVKPVRGSASQGVIRADGEQDLREAYRRLRRIVRDQGLDTGGWSHAEQLVESYLDGSEVSVELLMRDGTPHVLCLFEKPHPLHGPFFEETIYVTPARLSAEQTSQIQELAGRAAMAIGLRSGLAHCEIRLSSAGPFVLEIAARVIGGACSRVFRHVIGEDIHAYVLRLALGDDVPLPKQQPAAAGAMMLPIPRAGRLVDVRGIDRVRKIPGIQDVIITASPGDVIVPFPEQSCYVGFLTAKADTVEAVEEALVRAAGRIDLDLDPLVCEYWTREIDDHRAYQPPDKHHIRSLGAYEPEEALDIVLPIVASVHFSELPLDLAMAEARKCVRWLEEGPRGATSPSFWLVAEDRGVALGSISGDTCYVSCLGVVPERRRSGLGTALVRSIMAIFAQQGGARMRVLLDPRETAPNSLYRRLDFIPETLSEQSCCTC